MGELRLDAANIVLHYYRYHGTMANSFVDPVEDWLLRKLRKMRLDDWVVEGLTSSALMIEDKDDVLLTLQNFLGKDDHGTLRALVDELFCLRERYHEKDETTSLRSMTADRFVETSISPKTPSRQTGENEPIRLQDLDSQVLNCLGCGKIFDLRAVNGIVSETARSFLHNRGTCSFCGASVPLRSGGVVGNFVRELPAAPLSAGSASSVQESDGRSRINTTTTCHEVDSKSKNLNSQAFMCGQYDSSADASQPGAIARAIDAKDRLVDFDRTAASRTVVIDDQSDWFEIDGNSWLDEQERAEMKKQAQEMMEAQEQRRLSQKKLVTVDLLGRQVLQPAFDLYAERTTSLQGEDRFLSVETSEFSGTSEEGCFANPSVAFAPVFVTPALVPKALQPGRREREPRRESGVGGGQAPRPGEAPMIRTTSSSEPHRQSKMVGAVGFERGGLDSSRRRVLDVSPFAVDIF